MEDYKDRLTQQLFTDPNLDKLCTLTADLIGVPVALTLPTRTIIAHSEDYSEGLLHAYTNGMEMASEEEIRQVQESLDQKIQSRRPIIEAWPYQKFKHLDCGCFSYGKLVAVLDCPIINRIDESVASERIVYATGVFVTAMRLHGYISNNPKGLLETFFTSLLQNTANLHQQLFWKDPEIEKVKSWVLLLGIPASSSDLDSMEQKVTGYIRKRSSIWCVRYDQLLVLFADASKSNYLTDLEKIVSEYGVGCIGEPFSNLQDVSFQFHAVKTAYHLSVYEQNSEKTISVRNYNMPMLYLDYCSKEGLGGFENRILKEIKQHDLDHGTEYYETLRAYLLCKQDVKQISDFLHIHKNTVNYRLNRIVEMFNLDLKDCRVITNIYLSLFDDLNQNKPLWLLE